MDEADAEAGGDRAGRMRRGRRSHPATTKLGRGDSSGALGKARRGKWGTTRATGRGCRRAGGAVDGARDALDAVHTRRDPDETSGRLTRMPADDRATGHHSADGLHRRAQLAGSTAVNWPGAACGRARSDVAVDALSRTPTVITGMPAAAAADWTADPGPGGRVDPDSVGQHHDRSERHV